jgi:hypothetical protein
MLGPYIRRGPRRGTFPANGSNDFLGEHVELAGRHIRNRRARPADLSLNGADRLAFELLDDVGVVAEHHRG